MMRFHYVQVWDGFVRFTHWAILALVAISFATAKTHRMEWHMLCGYAALTLLIFRIAWGFVGSENARFRAFLGSPAAAFRQLGKLGRAEPDREVSHNPAGGWMVVILLALLLTQAITGLFAFDQVFTRGPLANRAPEWVVDLATSVHLRNFYILLGAIVIHVIAIAIYRVSKGQDLLVPMVVGSKRLPEDVEPPRHASPKLGLALLAASAATVYGITALRVW
jgi:cytochrome b